MRLSFLLNTLLVQDVVRVVHVGDAAVKKRLLEFAATPSGALTVDEFLNLQVGRKCKTEMKEGIIL